METRTISTKIIAPRRQGRKELLTADQGKKEEFNRRLTQIVNSIAQSAWRKPLRAVSHQLSAVSFQL